VFGTPAAATAEKGHAITGVVIDALLPVLRDVAI
jgi:creatinine amidohydrolase/Fe(II)-dependent formamide hydrolase-like protein